jgi:glucan phosphoethanolaminetransferase (alkaline phosphatase superfamily)
MIRFTDAISATSSTIHSIFFMLTDARIQTKYEWPHYAVCEYFRKLGVARISLHDMQRSHGAWSSVTSMLFVNADLRRSYSDDGRNHCDGEMLENVAADCADDPGGAKMIFVHLMGSHYDQRYRVPEEWLRTHGSAVSGMDFYDKSIVYTGFVIAELRKMTDKSARPAFLLYIPDHSEEPDSRRSSTVPDPVYYEIPMYLFFNAAYEREYPEIVALARQAADKPFQTDLTLQLIARLMGVPETLLKPEEDLLSPGYKPPVRLIGMGEIPYPEKTAPKRK